MKMKAPERTTENVVRHHEFFDESKDASLHDEAMICKFRDPAYGDCPELRDMSHMPETWILQITTQE